MRDNTMEAFLTLVLDGYPLADGWEFTAQLGRTNDVLNETGPGSDMTRPHFSRSPKGLPEARAVEIFQLLLSSEVVRSFPGITFIEDSRAKPGNQDALNLLAAEFARAGAKMFIRCLRDHPNPGVREQFIRAITKDTPISSFL
ncbi:MAG: hypothetical protein WCG73_00535 [Candidatus Moraniibacteriota bacterium]